jgi:hypothetical protein
LLRPSASERFIPARKRQRSCHNRMAVKKPRANACARRRERPPGLGGADIGSSTHSDEEVTIYSALFRVATQDTAAKSCQRLRAQDLRLVLGLKWINVLCFISFRSLSLVDLRETSESLQNRTGNCVENDKNISKVALRSPDIELILLYWRLSFMNSGAMRSQCKILQLR